MHNIITITEAMAVDGLIALPEINQVYRYVLHVADKRMCIYRPVLLRYASSCSALSVVVLLIQAKGGTPT